MSVVAIGGHDRTTSDEIGDLVEEAEYPYRRAYKRMLRLAEYLGMIHEQSDEYRLT